MVAIDLFWRGRTTPDDPSSEAGDGQEPWRRFGWRLAELFSEHIVTGRFQEESCPRRARDAAGVRLVVPDAATLDRALGLIRRELAVIGVKDQRQGRPATPYYRAVHAQVEVDGTELEVQLRTSRHHRIAQWAHDRLLVPATRESAALRSSRIVDSYLGSLAEILDVRDAGVPEQRAPLPRVPAALEPHALALRLVPTDGVTRRVPFFAHATRTPETLEAILRDGAILCGSAVPARVPRFSRRADDWAGRTQSVMLSPGFGYLVDNPTLCAALLFGEEVAQLRTAEFHRQPEVFRICALILEGARTHQRTSWRRRLRRPPTEWSVYDRPHVRATFCEYLRHQFDSDAPALAWRDAWGPSTYSEGVLDLLYFQNEALRPFLDVEIASFRSSNRIPGGTAALDWIRSCWAGGVYLHPCETPLPATAKNHAQLLVRHGLPLNTGDCLGLCVSPAFAPEVALVLRRQADRVRAVLGADCPVLCNDRVYTVSQFVLSASRGDPRLGSLGGIET